MSSCPPSRGCPWSIRPQRPPRYKTLSERKDHELTLETAETHYGVLLGRVGRLPNSVPHPFELKEWFFIITVPTATVRVRVTSLRVLRLFSPLCFARCLR